MTGEIIIEQLTRARTTMRRMQLHKFCIDAENSRSLVHDAIVACMTSVDEMQKDHLNPPAFRDGDGEKRDVTRELAEAFVAATRDTKDEEVAHGLAVHEKARATASHQATERELVMAATDAERTLTTIRDSVSAVTDRLLVSSARVNAARSATESAIATTNGHAAAENRFTNGKFPYADALVELTYIKASLVVALREEDAVAAEATRLADALDQYDLGSMKGGLVVALEHTSPAADFIVARNDVYDACRFVVSVYTDLADNHELIDGTYTD